MGLINLSNITEQDIFIKKEHPFKVCLELDEEVVNELEMAAAYTCKVKHWDTNTTILKEFTTTVENNVVTVSSTGASGLRLGEYHFTIQPVSPTLTTYITITGGLTVE